MTPEDEEFNRIEMESRIKQEYVRTMRKTTRQEKISRPAVYAVPTEAVLEMRDYIRVLENLVRELGDRLAKLEKPWVDLTLGELSECLVEGDPCEALAEPEAWEVMSSVQTKLKEKNT